MKVYPIMIKSESDRQRLQIFLFIISAYLLPFGCIISMNHTAWGQIDIVYFILFGIEAASPTIAAIMIVLCFDKKSGIKAFFQSNFSPKLKLSTVLSCVVIAFFIFFIAKVISCLLLRSPFKLAEINLKQFIVILWAFVAEEIGWRGFLTRKLSASLNEMIVPILVGVIWAFWHYHFFLIGTIQVAFPLFITGCVIDSYLYALLLYMAKGNVLAAMIFHMSSNLFVNLFLISPSVNGGNSIPYIFYVVLSAAFVIGITVVLEQNKKGYTFSINRLTFEISHL